MSGWGGGRRGDRMVLKWTPTNFTPDAAAGGVSSSTMLAAILAGIDTALGSGSSFAGVESLEIEASSFTYDGANNVSTYTLPSAVSSDTAYRDFVVLAKSGVLVMENKSPSTPSGSNEYKVDGTTLYIYGDVTASGDTYGMTYAIQ